jgi:hypothetical protein
MTRSALIDKELLPLCRELEAGMPVFVRELAMLRSEHFVPWHEVAAYSGGWVVCPLVIQIDPVPPVYDLERNRRLCPRSYALVARPRILLAGFSRLMPGCRVLPHTDRPKAGVLRFHLGLGDAAGAALVFDDVEVAASRGSGVLFDQSLTHAAHNTGSQPRDALVVDIELTAGETDALLRSRGAVHWGPTAAS